MKNWFSNFRLLLSKTPAMETGIRLDTITTLSLVRSQWTKGKTVSPEAGKVNYKLLC